MARKNVFEVVESPSQQEHSEPVTRPRGRPLMGLELPVRPAGAVGAISQSLETINTRAQRADEIEKKLARGQAVVEIDPDLVDFSIVVDRLGVDAEQQSALIAQIREHGQQVPILLRPHPEREGRYQVAYGHRRLAAVKEIGGRVRAIIRELTDEQLVVSQGQENNSRTDLTYIERCHFAANLQGRGFSRDVIMAALGVDKAALSRMIALAVRIPSELIEGVGRAPSFGRQRWAELADLLEERGKKAKALKMLEDREFLAEDSDGRFQKLYSHLKTAEPKPRSQIWSSSDGIRPVKITDSGAKLTLSFDKRVEPNFGLFVQERLQALYDDYRSRRSEE